MTAIGDIYTAQWFAHDFADLQPEFDLVGAAIVRQFRPRMAADIGCGPGLLLHALKSRHVAVWGYEGSEHGIAYAKEFVRQHISHADITEMSSLDTAMDLIICTEVAEHLAEEHAAGLVALLSSAMCPIIWTAAPKGQDGHHHVNCQPREYWERLFRARGVIPDHRATQQLKERWWALQKLGHMRENLQVWR